MINRLTSNQNNEIQQLFRSVNGGDGFTQDRVKLLIAQFEPIILPADSERIEQFALCDSSGNKNGMYAPRWLCHLVGLRHRAVEVGLCTASGLVVLQIRSSTKSDWAGLPDMAVSGHLVGDAEFDAAAMQEVEEEIGLSKSRASEWFREGKLTRLGNPYLSLDIEANREIPYFNREVRQIFTGTLTAAGLDAISFNDGEVGGLMLVTQTTAWEMLTRGEIASGMRYTLPRYLEWLERKAL